MNDTPGGGWHCDEFRVPCRHHRREKAPVAVPAPDHRGRTVAPNRPAGSACSARPPAGPSFITAPDGQDIAYTYDELGRVSSVTGGTSYDMFASVTYDRVGRVKEVTRGFSTDATKTVYVYDEAGRTTQIRHETIVGPSTLHQTTYVWNLNNTLASRVETDNFGLTVASVAFTYDNRDRLIREEREQAYNGGSAATAYDYRYGYDQLGNRKWRIDAATSERPAYYYTYLYDTDVDPGNLDWPTRNNRLLKYEIRKDSTSGDLLRTVSYTYYKTGHASNITVKDWYVDSSTTPGSASDYDWYHDLALYYFTNGSLRLAMNDKWKVYVDGGTGQSSITDYTSLTAREFRYDGIGIARYLAVDYNTNNEPTDPGEWTLVGSPMLTDYAGSAPLTDSSITYSSSYSAIAETRYFAGDGRQSLGSGGSVEDLRYFHGDLINSRVMATDDSAAAVSTTAYTAFGEVVPPIGAPSRPANPSTLDTRYQYAGSFGYEAGMLGATGPNTNLAVITLSHVGARWYQSDIGRFVQRDPIGLGGGFNLYVYCMAEPTCHVDPTGHITWDDVVVGVSKGFIFVTGGRNNPWIDTQAGRDTVQRVAIGAVIGVAILCVPGAAPIATRAAMGWGMGRYFGGSTGSAWVDELGDGAAMGIGIGTVAGGPRLPKPRPRKGVLEGFPGSVNPPRILP